MGKTRKYGPKNIEEGIKDSSLDDVYEKMKDKVYSTVKNMGYELVDFSIKKGRKILVEVEIYLKNRDVSIKDCEKVSNVLSRLFDVEDPIPFNYTLLVSSPGADRNLKTVKDFEIFSGREVEVDIKNFGIYGLPSSHQIMKIVGVDGDVIKFDLDGREVWVDFSDIENTKLYFDFYKYFGGEKRV